MRIGVPKEIKVMENRVGMTPGGVSDLVRHGLPGCFGRLKDCMQILYTRRLFLFNTWKLKHVRVCVFS